MLSLSEKVSIPKVFKVKFVTPVHINTKVKLLWIKTKCLLQIVSEKQILKMHELKTARLFEFCLIAPLILSGKSNPAKLRYYKKYGKNFGLIFQATDDLIDNIGDKNITGKKTQKDLKKNKGNIMKYKSIEIAF